VTLSIGVTELELDPGWSPEEMLRQLFRTSDLAMYRAKKTGRNRQVLYSEALEGEAVE
jgi:PleD family two-component response regulator